MSVPTPRSEPDNPIDEAVRAVIRRKARSLVGRAGLTLQDCPDLEQELTLCLLVPLREAEPRPGSRRAAHAQFLVERFAANILRDRRAAKRNGGPIASLSGHHGADGTELGALVTAAERDAVRGTARLDEAERRELALDVAEVLDRLPDELRGLGAALTEESLAALARRLGVPRTTLRDRLRSVRERFADGNLDAY